jgi:hypothetical protein
VVALGAAIAALVSFGRELPANYFGMCNGMPADDQKSSLSLTAWLHDYLNGLAGKSTAEPLTFGELWGGKLRAPGASALPLVAGERVLDLAMMTTAVNLGRPYSHSVRVGRCLFHQGRDGPAVSGTGGEMAGRAARGRRRRRRH